MTRSITDWVAEFRRGRISRREFVERAATGGLGLLAAQAVLAAEQARKKPAVPAPPAHGAGAHHAHHAAPPKAGRNQTNVNPYDEWLEAEGIPVYREYGIANLRDLRVVPWKRMGASGAYIDLKGGEGVNDGYVLEITPGGKTAPQRYLFEEVLYVLDGEGETAVWAPGRDKRTVRWQRGAIIGPPLNTWRQHFNRGRAPARMVAITNAPVVIDLFHSTDFVFNNDYVFRDRWSGEEDPFGAGPDRFHHKETTSEESEIERGVHTWDSGFVPDARSIGLKVVKERGAGNSRIELQLADNTMQAHISEFEVGTYKKAHRHGPGSHVVMLNGKGYTLMWRNTPRFSESRDHVRVDWTEASLFVPPDGWFHQHFNTSADPARYLAATWGGDGKWFMRALGGGGRTHRLGKTSIRKGGNLIEYEDEDPAIREVFEAELKKSGVESRMRRA
jgi:oxalate decarboxylase/phosphoglucose isomerase-like protein (cupin superfamily)